MSDRFVFKRNDTKPFRSTLLDANKAPVNLGVDPNQASVRFLMTPATPGIGQTVSGQMTVLQELAGDMVTVLDRGKVEYAWQTGETALAGIHRAEIEVTYLDGTVQTFPNEDWIDVVIQGDLG